MEISLLSIDPVTNILLPNQTSSVFQEDGSQHPLAKILLYMISGNLSWSLTKGQKHNAYAEWGQANAVWEF